LTCLVQVGHKALQDVERRQASNSATVERQQAEASCVDWIWLSSPLFSQRLLHRCVRRLGGYSFRGSEGIVEMLESRAEVALRDAREAPPRSGTKAMLALSSSDPSRPEASS